MTYLSKAQQSLFLFFETCCVDGGGLVGAKHMNKEDIEIAKVWEHQGFVTFDRICMADIDMVTDKNYLIMIYMRFVVDILCQSYSSKNLENKLIFS